MHSRAKGVSWALWVGGLCLALPLPGAETFRVATYNLENYLDQPTETRPHPKSAIAKAKVRESIRALKPDVIALQEVGSPSALDELRRSLKTEGLDFSHWEHVAGFDTNIHVAILSRLPITARRSHTNDSYLLGGRRFRVSRGIGEVDIQVTPRYSFTLLTVHLKSRRPVPEADEAEQRLEEARILREIISADLAANPDANLILAGDFNDTKDSAAIRTLLGRGRHKLVDTRPAEQGGADVPRSSSGLDPRTVTWTHYYGKQDTYSRIDYVLLSPGMAREWVTNETYVLALPDWGIASDHRPLVATFEAKER
jgi:endonuclease/exonuclease/phosphatase family metal-dependent hydrolase